MSETPTRPPAPKRGIISTPLSLLGRVCATLLTSVFFSLIVEWVGIAFFWPEQGAEHSHQMMNTELHWFSENVTHSVLVSDPAGTLTDILQQTWNGLFVDTGFIPWAERLRHRPDFEALSWVSTYLQATVYIILTFVLRVFILVLTAPLFLLAALIGMTDGLVRRDIRRFGNGYESGFIYHHAKQLMMPVFFLAWLLYLSLPFSVNPTVILLPAAFLFGLIISITTGSFKKYL